jgi:ABC-type branched-subunit amino acid transport system ATPase component
MAKLVKLNIKNYRGIKDLTLDFDHTRNIVCLIGRGDSCKSTVLDAIASVLSPAWNLSFHDTDFYNCEHAQPIEITAHLIDIPEKLLSVDRFGLYLRKYDPATKDISDEIDDAAIEGSMPLLSIRLVVDHTLEPNWIAFNGREQEEKRFGSSERSLLNCYIVADNLDRHFSWSRGNPLYSILRSGDIDAIPGEKNVILETLRIAKAKIDAHDFPELKEVTDHLTVRAAQLGLDITGTRTTLDFKDLSIKDGRVTLHDGAIPFRLKGKGSKRLISFAIQLAFVKNGGIMLVDEIEQGLEPDRIRQLVRSLKETENGMIFISTHSREVIVELGSSPLCLLVKDRKGEKIESRRLGYDEATLTKVIRACPEAFFATKVIVAEGATEVGICRALDSYRTTLGKESMSFRDCAYVDGTGNTLLERVNTIQDAGIKTALLCDSDEVVVNGQKASMNTKGIEVFDCEGTNCLEVQVLNDLPWDGIRELLDYVLLVHKNGNLTALTESVKAKYPIGAGFPEDWKETDRIDTRKAIALAAVKKDNEWFKRIDHGELLGKIIFKYFDAMNDEVYLKKMLNSLSIWIDN